MIARHWRGWTTPKDADAYEALLRDSVLPSLKQIAGYHGAYVLRRELQGEVEFIVLNFFESIERREEICGPPICHRGLRTRSQKALEARGTAGRSLRRVFADPLAQRMLYVYPMLVTVYHGTVTTLLNVSCTHMALKRLMWNFTPTFSLKLKWLLSVGPVSVLMPACSRL